MESVKNNLRFMSIDNRSCSVFCGKHVGSLVSIPEIAPDGRVVVSVAYCAFFCEQNIEEVVIPGSVVSIENSAFYHCANLRRITFGDGIKNIGLFAFKNCESLRVVLVPDSVTKIGYHAFVGCSGLERVILPRGLISDFLRELDLYQPAVDAYLNDIGLNSDVVLWR